jgi:hypothetical protein
MEIAYVAPIFALIGTALGAWLVDRFAGKRWLIQQQWESREKHYVALLDQLRRAELALRQQDDYYIEPGSEHRDHRGNAHFNQLEVTASKALPSVKELTGPAILFISDDVASALSELETEEWTASMYSSFPGEYVDMVLPKVKAARDAIKASGRIQLSMHRRPGWQTPAKIFCGVVACVGISFQFYEKLHPPRFITASQSEILPPWVGWLGIGAAAAAIAGFFLVDIIDWWRTE